MRLIEELCALVDAQAESAAGHLWYSGRINNREKTMAIIFCTECSGKISDTAATCPHCGAPGPTPAPAPAVDSQTATAKKSGGIWKWIFGVPVGLFVLMIIYGSLISNPERIHDRNVYETCMDSLKSDDRARSGNGAFIGGVCEKMRNDFIKKYGTTP